MYLAETIRVLIFMRRGWHSPLNRRVADDACLYSWTGNEQAHLYRVQDD